VEGKKMFKRFRISALILTAAAAMTALPAVSQARDRNDDHGRPVVVSQAYDRDDYRRGPAERSQYVSPERARFDFDARSAPRGYWDANGVWCNYSR
jgi:hypothetical protein